MCTSPGASYTMVDGPLNCKRVEESKPRALWILSTAGLVILPRIECWFIGKRSCDGSIGTLWLMCAWVYHTCDSAGSFRTGAMLGRAVELQGSGSTWPEPRWSSKSGISERPTLATNTRHRTHKSITAKAAQTAYAPSLPSCGRIWCPWQINRKQFPQAGSCLVARAASSAPPPWELPRAAQPPFKSS